MRRYAALVATLVVVAGIIPPPLAGQQLLGVPTVSGAFCQGTLTGCVLSVAGYNAPAVLYVSADSTGTPAGTTLDTLKQYTVPTNLLAATSWGFKVTGWGHVANDTTTKNVVLRIAGKTVDSLSVSANRANFWRMSATVLVRSLTDSVQALQYLGVQGDSATATYTKASTVKLLPTTAPRIVFLARHNGAAAITQDGLVVEWIRYP